MREMLNLLLLLFFFSIIIVFPLYSSDEMPNTAAKSSKIEIDKILFSPSSFLTATEDHFVISAYLRTQTEEGKIPNDFQETIEKSEKIISFRLRQWGLTLGWSGKENDTLSKPRILSVDYKIPLTYKKGNLAFATDFKYSTKKIPGSTIRKSLLDFGVFSMTGIVEKEISWILQIYGGLTENYIYVDAASDILIDAWKPVPFLGVKINVSPYNAIQIVSEINRAQDDFSKNPVWTWHFGVSLGY